MKSLVLLQSFGSGGAQDDNLVVRFVNSAVPYMVKSGRSISCQTNWNA